MGFRSTITSQHIASFEYPEWFQKKYDYLIYNGSIISSKHETKFYGTEFFEDVQKALYPHEYLSEFALALLHEDGNITRVMITEDSIKYEWMFEGIEEKRPYTT